MATVEQQRALARARARVRVQREARNRARPQAPEGPNRAQATEGARYALARAQQRQAGNVLGLGGIGQALYNTATDPARRAEAGRSFQGLVRDVQQIPSLAAGRLARDTAQTIGRSVQNIDPGAILGALPGALWEATGVPSAQREERAQQDVDMARIQGRDPSQAARRANENTAQLGLTIAAPLALGGSPSMVRAAGVGAAADAPFALNRNSEQPLQQRLPSALTEIGAVGATGGATQLVANSIGRAAARRENSITQTRRRTQEFDQAGVRPFLAATHGGGAAPMTMMLAENPIGGNVRRNLNAAVQDVSRGAERLADRFGEAPDRVVAGEAVQSGVRRLARGAGQGREMPMPRGYRQARNVPVREWSVPDKARALYDPIFEDLDFDYNQMQGAVEGPLLTLDRTQQTMDQIVGRISGNRSQQRLTNQTLRTMVDEMTADLADGSLSFADMRRWRTTIREMKGDDQLRQGISRAELSRIESALTDDIYRSADNIGGQAARDLRSVDRWYRAINDRIENRLERYYGADGGERAVARIMEDARPGGNIRRVEALRASLRDDEWRSLATSVINDLGRARKGQAHIDAFNLDTFVSNYQDISPAARRALFSGRGMGTLGEDLEQLVRVAGYMKEVRGFTNWSHSGQSIQNFSAATAAGAAGAAAMAGNIAPAVGVVLTAILGRLTGEMLTNPRLVRLIVQAPKAGQTAAAAQAWLRRLAEIAARDPAVGALLATELAHDQTPAAPGQPAPQRQTAEPVQ